MGRECKIGINDIRTKRPDIATYMENYNKHYKIIDRNIPDKISYSGKAHIFLRCEHGHDFDDVAFNINRLKRDENGIIYCRKCHELGIRKMPYIPRKTYQQTLYDYCVKNNKQYLLDEWNHEENNKIGLSPKEVGKGSNKKAFWTCPLGHIYDMDISDRKDGGNCPYCSGTRLLVGFNDLLSQYPDVCKDWDYSKNKKKPEEYLQHSSEKVYWKCHKCGYEWPAQISHRTSKINPSGCSKCINHGMSRIEMCIYLSIKKYLPDAEYRKKIDGIEFDIYIPSEHFAIEYDGCYFHGESKTKRDAKKDEKAKEKGITFLRIKEEAKVIYDFLLDDNILHLNTNYNTKYKEICQKILEILKNNYSLNVETSVSNTIIQEAIAQINTLNYENSLEAKYPEIAKEWHPTKNGILTPDKVDYSSHTPAWWICSGCGYEYPKDVHRRTDKNGFRAGKCARCTGKIREKGFNDLETLYPGIINHWVFNKNTGTDFYLLSPSGKDCAYWDFGKGPIQMQTKSAVQKYKKMTER